MKAILKIIKISKTSKYIMSICIIMAIISSMLAVLPSWFLGFTVTSLSKDTFSGFIYDFVKIFVESPAKYNLAVAGVVLFLLSSILFIIFRNFFCYIAITTAQYIIINVRKELFKKLTKIDFKEITKRSKGDLIYILMNDTQRLEYIFERPFYTIFSDVFDFIFISIFLIYIEPMIFMILLIVMPFIYIFSIKTAKIQKRTSSISQEADSKMTVAAEQLLSGYETIKSFNAEKTECERFDKLSEISYNNRKIGIKSLSIFMPIEGCLRTIGICLVLLYAIHQINLGLLEVGMIVVFSDYSYRFYNPVRNVFNYLQTIQKSIVSIEKILQFLEIEDEKEKNIAIKNQNNINHPISVRNLKIKIDDKVLISNISFVCNKNELIQIRGQSGSGKTSIVRALIGLYKVDDGMIFIHGKDINSYSNIELRSIISYCGQYVFLHNDTVLKNIFYPDYEYDTNRVLPYLKKLNLDHMDNDELIGDGGNKLSGGEKLRVAFLRAILKNSKILILDETTSSLDTDNEDIIIETLKGLKKDGWTIIFCTHSTNDKLNRITDQTIHIRKDAYE